MKRYENSKQLVSHRSLLWLYVLTVRIIPPIMTSQPGPIGSLASRWETPPCPPHFSKLHMLIYDPLIFYNHDFEILVVLGMFRLRGKAHNARIKPFSSIQDLGMTLRIATIWIIWYSLSVLTVECRWSLFSSSSIVGVTSVVWRCVQKQSSFVTRKCT